MMRTLDLTRPFSRAYGLTRGRIYMPAAIATVSQWREPGPGYTFADTAGFVPITPGAETARDNDRRGARWGHDIQATVAARPVTGRRPRGGVRNLLLGGSRNFASNAFWGQFATVEQLGPIGAFDVSQRIGDAFGTLVARTHTIPLIVGQACTVSGHIKAGAATTTSMNLATNGSNPSVRFVKDGTGALNLQLFGGSSGSLTLVDVPNGIYRFAVTYPAATVTSALLNILPAIDGGGAGTGDFIAVGDWQVERGVVATPAQTVLSPLDITEAGQPDVWYHQGTLGGKRLVSDAPLDLSGADKASIVICLEKLTDVDGFTAFDHGGAFNGGFEVEKAAGLAQWSAATRVGGAIARAGRTGVPAPNLAVVSAVLDRTAGILRMRYNGVDVAPLSLGATSPLANAVTSVLARADGSRPFAGNYFGRVYGAGEFTTAEFQLLEAHFIRSKGVAA